jgi:hypothetical protein
MKGTDKIKKEKENFAKEEILIARSSKNRASTSSHFLANSKSFHLISLSIHANQHCLDLNKFTGHSI